MEVKNPLFNDDPTPKNPWRHPPGKKQTNKNPWTSFIGERDQKEKRPTRDLMANIDQSYCFHQARRHLPPIGQKAYFQQKSHINKEFIGCYQQYKNISSYFTSNKHLLVYQIMMRLEYLGKGKRQKCFWGLTYSESFNYYVVRWKQLYAVFYKGCKVVSGRVYKNARAGCEGWRRFVNLKTTFATDVIFSIYDRSKSGFPNHEDDMNWVAILLKTNYVIFYL